MYAAQVVWDTLVPDVIEDFTPYPDDSLADVYAVADENWKFDILLRVLEELSMPVPEQTFVDQFGSVDSSRLVAKFITACRTHAQASSQRYWSRTSSRRRGLLAFLTLPVIHMIRVRNFVERIRRASS